MTIARLAWLTGSCVLLAGLVTVAVAPPASPFVPLIASAVVASVCVAILGRSVLRPLARALAAVRETKRRLQATVAQSQRDRAEMATIFEHMADGASGADSMYAPAHTPDGQVALPASLADALEGATSRPKRPDGATARSDRVNA